MKGFYCYFVLLLSFVCLLEAKGVCPPETCGYNAPYKVASCNEYFLEMDFLYWEAIEENLSLGCTSTEVICTPFTFDPGFRVQAGKFFSWDDWQVFVEYTRFYQTTRTTKEGGSIIPYWAPVAETFSSVNGKWNLKFDEGSISLGRDAYVGRCTTSRIHIGLEALSIRQKMKVKYDNDSTNIKSENDLYSWAIGPRIGWDSKWFICNNFQIFSEIRGSLVYTDYTKNQQNVFTNGNKTSIATRDCNGAIRPIMDMSMGFGWGCYFKKSYLNIKAGYSARILWNQNHFVNNSYCYSQSGDLYLHGLTLYFAFYF